MGNSIARRILGMHDWGEDVRLLQHGLNRRLYQPALYPIDIPDWRILSKRLNPELWGYCWTPGALAKFRKHHADPYRWRRPNGHIKKAPPLAEDGRFGPKTEKAVILYQAKVGLPDDGIAGPEVWEHLFPFWIIGIFVYLEETEYVVTGPGAPQPGQPAPKLKKVFIGSPLAKTELDNIANQVALQTDKDGLTKVFVLQATWKTERAPREIVPGRWEHTGGLQVNTPADSPLGKNVQAFYQLTRADMLSLRMSDDLRVTGDLWVQPTVQVPLDKGTPDNHNQPKVGITGGGTVSLEIKGEGTHPTVKVFVQGGYAASLDRTGNFEKGPQVLAGVSAEFDVETLFAPKHAPSSSGPAQGLGMTINPGVVTLKPGGSASVKVTTTRTAQDSVQILVGNLPNGVWIDPAGIDKIKNSGTLTFRARPNAPAADRSDVVVGVDFSPPGSPSAGQYVSAKIRLIVQP